MLLKSHKTTKVSDKIEMPSIIDLINSPFYKGVSLDDAYKHGNDVIRYLIDNTPLKNNTKYQTMQFIVQYLNPQVIPVDYAGWHQDVSDDNQFTTHLLLSKCTGMTEFLAEDIEVDQPESYLENEDVKGIACQPDRFITFTDEWHRAGRAKKNEFRFMMRVLENNQYVPYSYEESHINQSVVYVPNREGVILPSIVKEKDEIVVHQNRGK